MIIKSCFIENFGIISNLSLDFTDGLNKIVEDNGWGKSTFASFVRAMFYGLDGGGKKSILDNERKRYKPWQGGVFGGRLTFEIEGIEYEITRRFGDKDSADEFELRDARTNIISTDYSDRIGEEIFNIDRKSFMRTMFIGQGDCSSEVTDDINAKVGNITDDTNDLNNYERAVGNLSDIMNALNPKRKTGSIAKRREDIAQCEKRIFDKKDIESSLTSYQNLMTEAVDKKTLLKEELTKNNELQKEVSHLQKLLAKKDEYDRLSADLNSKKENYDRAREFFKEEVPSIEAVEAKIDELEALSKLRERASMLELTDGEKSELKEGRLQFADGIPAIIDIDEKISDVALLTELRNRIAIDSVVKPVPIILLILGAILAVAGIGVAVISIPVVGIALVILGVVMLTIGVIKKKANAPDKEMIKKADSLSDDISSYLKSYGLSDAEAKYKDTLYLLKDQSRSYKELKVKNDSYKDTLNNIKESESDIRAFVIMNADGLRDEELTAAVKVIRNKVTLYEEAQRAYNEAKRRLSELTSVYSEDELKDESRFKDIPSLDEVQHTINEITEKLDQINDTILNYDNIIDGLQSQYDELSEDKELLAKLNEEQAIENERFRLISIAKQKLEEAKQELTLKYSGPILKSFGHYYKMITNEATDRFRIDADINLTYDSEGSQRQILSLSEGYKDLTGIALRLALIEAMYESENPVIIMDDPFVNLDDDKARNALGFLDEVAKKYQIIYLTCSKKRISG